MTTLSPLAEIEAFVQRAAKDRGIDPASAQGADELATLVDHAIEVWQAEHRRGTRPRAIADPARLAERARRNLVGYGPLEPLLHDDDVWEIMINAPDAIFVKRHGSPSGYHDEAFHDDDHVERVLTKLLDDASTAHRKLDPAEGLQDAQLDDGSRVHIVHADLSRGGHLMVNIRKFTGVQLRTLDQLVARGTLTDAAARFLRAAVRARSSLLIAGAPGAGKTTLLSCCASELDPRLRVVVAEEVFEADVPVANVASMQTRQGRGDRAPVDLRRLVAGFLRMAPDVAIVGEVRDREALPLLLTLSSGVTGFTTIHAGSTRQALARLRFVCHLDEVGRTLPHHVLTTLVAETIDARRRWPACCGDHRSRGTGHRSRLRRAHDDRPVHRRPAQR
jgi:pilus assembly protein CpaF